MAIYVLCMHAFVLAEHLRMRDNRFEVAPCYRLRLVTHYEVCESGTQGMMACWRVRARAQLPPRLLLMRVRMVRCQISRGPVLRRMFGPSTDI